MKRLKFTWIAVLISFVAAIAFAGQYKVTDYLMSHNSSGGDNFQQHYGPDLTGDGDTDNTTYVMVTHDAGWYSDGMLIDWCLIDYGVDWNTGALTEHYKWGMQDDGNGGIKEVVDWETYGRATPCRVHLEEQYPITWGSPGGNDVGVSFGNSMHVYGGTCWNGEVWSYSYSKIEAHYNTYTTMPSDPYGNTCTDCDSHTFKDVIVLFNSQIDTNLNGVARKWYLAKGVGVIRWEDFKVTNNVFTKERDYWIRGVYTNSGGYQCADDYYTSLGL